MSEQQIPTSNNREVRISANDIVTTLNKILRAIEDQNKLIQTQTGILTAVLKTAAMGRGASTAPLPKINPAQAGYPSMATGGKSHVPGQLTGLEPPQWTGESAPIQGETLP